MYKLVLCSTGVPPEGTYRVVQGQKTCSKYTYEGLVYDVRSTQCNRYKMLWQRVYKARKRGAKCGSTFASVIPVYLILAYYVSGEKFQTGDDLRPLTDRIWRPL